MRNVARHGKRQGGVVAPTTALALVVLVAFLGVAVDVGRLFVIKTELQNAADACALAAAQELDGNAGALTRAENSGITAGTRNGVHFQSAPVVIAVSDVKFSTTLSSASGDNSNYQTQAAGAPANSRYAMCTVTLPGVPMSLTSIVGVGPQTVAAAAVATVAPAQTSCAIPLGLCSQGSPPSFGFVAAYRQLQLDRFQPACRRPERTGSAADGTGAMQYGHRNSCGSNRRAGQCRGKSLEFALRPVSGRRR
jgi:Flp pilus assembly protein TadG